MSKPFLSQGPVHFVPVVRHHLGFAVQVQRAAREMGLGGNDAVAVALPDSARPRVLEAVAALPTVSLVISSVSDTDRREVFPVTPADGMVEAIRIAVERDLPLWCVDQEVAPGHLVDRFCLNDEEWPDDGYALHHGAEAYLELVADQLLRPPARFEPVDSWRELHMAARLQELAGRHERILFVCDATHVQPLRRLLRRPVPPVEVGQSVPPRPRYTVVPPSLPVLMRYLDHIPRLVEVYERLRAQGQAHTFDKLDALLGIYDELSTGARDLRLSIRHYQAFVGVLTRLMEIDRLLSPRFEVLLPAAAGCFPAVFHERAFRHLLGYYDQVRVHRVGRIRGTNEAVFDVESVAPRRNPGFYVARNCTHMEQFYVFVPWPADERPGGQDGPEEAVDMPPGITVDLDSPPAPPRGVRSGMFDHTEAWPVMSLFINEMRAKAHTLARRPADSDVKSLEFTGSLADGIDVRRTLRSHLGPRPGLYVRHERVGRPQPVDSNEPIVWIGDGYDTVRPANPGKRMELLWCGSELRPLTVEWHLYESGGPRVSAVGRRGSALGVDWYRLYGRVQFLDYRLTQADVDRRLGDELPVRVPQIDVLASSELFREEMSDLYQLDLTFARWWEVMLVAALHYAKRSVVLVAPPTLVVPEVIPRRFAAQHKRIVRVSPERFTTEERRKLGLLYMITHKHRSRGDMLDPEYLDFIVDEFGDAMKSYWS
ncbi:hypothetical protein [Streptomyces sp. NPDC054940]